MFFKNFSQLQKSFKDPAELFIAAHKLSFIAIVFGQIEFAVDILNQVNSLPTHDQNTEEFRKQKIFVFLDKLYQQAKNSEPVYPKSYIEIMTPTNKEISSFSPPTPHLSFRKKIKQLVKRYPLALNAIRYLLNLPKRTKQFFLRLTRFWYLPFSPIEKLFIEYGFSETAKVIRKNRTNQQIFASYKPKSYKTTKP